jgi:hypothetical protein
MQGDRLPPWLAGCGSALAQQPRVVLLAALLQRNPADPDWFQLVVAGYVGTCILPLLQAERAAAEADLVEVLAHLGQQQVLGLAVGALLEEARATAVALAASAPATEELRPDLNLTKRASLRQAALRYFTSGPTLAAAAAAQLLLQGLGAGSVTPHGFLGTPPLLLEVEVLCLAILVPTWEQVLHRLQQGSRPPNSTIALDGQGQLAARQWLVQLLCQLCNSHCQLLLQLPPALLAEVCRESFHFTCRFTSQLVAAYEGEGAAPLMVVHIQQLLQYDDMVSTYIKRKLLQENTTA